jgi:two-component system nitrogen regulation response regulator GlnG
MLMRHFLTVAAKELNTEVKILTEEVDVFLKTLEWSGNVRQLENLCRWLTVMATGQVIQLEDLPKDLRENNRIKTGQGDDWREKLNQWAFHQLNAGKQDILANALPEFEKVMIEAALAFTGGKKQDASKLLGWGRNTLTRKIRELNILT